MKIKVKCTGRSGITTDWTLRTELHYAFGIVISALVGGDGLKQKTLWNAYKDCGRDIFVEKRKYGNNT